ncbi:MAG TPA: T9SS type A sorting domain-containing protein, partial [Bacteroidia bacterium]|nr:T9SS type A sorting domain-containing protein [Bacteroidia bacterium]
NPATNELKIQSAALRIESIDVYDLLGEKILHRTLDGESKALLDVRTLPAGVYFVTVRDEQNNSVIKKIVKM